MLQDHIWNAHYPMSMFAMLLLGMLLKYGPGAYLT